MHTNLRKHTQAPRDGALSLSLANSLGSLAHSLTLPHVHMEGSETFYRSSSLGASGVFATAAKNVEGREEEAVGRERSREVA